MSPTFWALILGAETVQVNAKGGGLGKVTMRAAHLSFWFEQSRCTRQNFLSAVPPGKDQSRQSSLTYGQTARIADAAVVVADRLWLGFDHKPTHGISLNSHGGALRNLEADMRCRIRYCDWFWTEYRTQVQNQGLRFPQRL